jgi:hypothetical protein
MLDLTIAPAGIVAPPAPDESDPATTVWRDDEGTIVARGSVREGRHWIHVPHLGAFAFAAAEREVTAIPDPGADPAIVDDAFRRMVLPLALQARGFEVLHASAVRTRAGVVALCARSRTGKSTIACALDRRGHSLWADDAVCFETKDDHVDALPLPFMLRLRPASVAFFGDDAKTSELREPVEAEPLAAAFILERSGAASPELSRLSPADAFRAVLTHGYCFSMHDRNRNSAMMRNYLELVERLPVFEIAIPHGLDRLDATLDLIESAVAG